MGSLKHLPHEGKPAGVHQTFYSSFTINITHRQSRKGTSELYSAFEIDTMLNAWFVMQLVNRDLLLKIC